MCLVQWEMKKDGSVILLFHGLGIERKGYVRCPKLTYSPFSARVWGQYSKLKLDVRFPFPLIGEGKQVIQRASLFPSRLQKG